jgi:hypothetical protein
MKGHHKGPEQEKSAGFRGKSIWIEILCHHLAVRT